MGFGVNMLRLTSGEHLESENNQRIVKTAKTNGAFISLLKLEINLKHEERIMLISRMMMRRGRGIPSGIIAPPPRLCNMSHMPQTLLVRLRYGGENSNIGDDDDEDDGDDENDDKKDEDEDKKYVDDDEKDGGDDCNCRGDQLWGNQE